jgi:glycosyltransferase involved in cell wall biosynthesis
VKIAFIGTMTLLDRYSGAALSVRAFLENLAAAGHECSSYTATSFDREESVPLEPIFGPGITTEAFKGRVVSKVLNGVRHNVYITSHTHRSQVKGDEWDRMAQTGVQWIRKEPANIYISFGQNAVTEILQRGARESGARLIYYAANAEHKHRKNIMDTDQVVCPSAFLASHYKETLQLNVDVVRTIIPSSRFLPAEDRIYLKHPQLRQQGFVTFFNPQLTKGVGLISRLIPCMQKRAPELNFLIVSGRTGKFQLQIHGKSLEEQENVWHIASQEDVRSIFKRTSILLVPSVWQEGASRSIVEAQLSGIPVIASNRGGNSERLNGGGFCLDLPPRLLDDPRIVPTEEEVEAWIKTLLMLWNDEKAYATAAANALKAAEPFQPDEVSRRALEYFENLVLAHEISS